MSKKISKIFLIFILCLNFILISQPKVYAQKPTATSLQEQMELIQNDIKVDDLDIEPINTEDLKKKVVPDTKKEGQKVLLLFFKTMFMVVLAGVIIYVTLLFIRKYRSSAFAENDYVDEYAALNLATPTNKQEAFVSFLNRTDF